MSGRQVEAAAYRFRMSQIYNFNTEKTEQADFWLSQGPEVIHQLRYSLRKNQKSYGCPFCKTPVILRKGRALKSGERGGDYFAHRKRKEGVKCHLCDQHGMTDQEVRLQQYNYAKETEEHIRLKTLIYETLRQDPHAQDVKMERIKRGTITPSRWKRPDVQCTYKGTEIVFEVQISNTWLSDIVERDTFYQRNNTFIMWVFNTFNSARPNDDVTRADIFYNNPNINLFVLDETAQEETIRSGRLNLTCYYKEPRIDHANELIQEFWTDNLIDLDGLSYDSSTYKPYFFNYSFKKAEAESKLEDLRQRKRTERIQEQQRLRDKNAAKAAEPNTTTYSIPINPPIPKAVILPRIPIEERLPKHYSQINDIDLLDLIFENRRSRNIHNLRRRVQDLTDAGFVFPTDVFAYLESAGLIRVLTEVQTQLQYERKR